MLFICLRARRMLTKLTGTISYTTKTNPKVRLT